MTKKRLVALSTCAIFALTTMLSGCGGTKKADDKNAAATTAPKSETKKVSGTIKLLTYDGKKSPTGEYLKQKQINEFMKKYPDIKVTLDMQSENNSVEFLKKLDLMALSGDTSDVITTPSYRDYADRALKDFFAPLDDYMKGENKTFDSLYSYPAQLNNKVFGLPANPGIYHVLINKKYLDAAGLPTPKADWTWDDYREYALKMTKGSGKDKVYGSYMHTWTEYRREALFVSKLDNPYVKDDGTSNLEDPTFKEWLKFVSDMEKVDKSQVPYFDAKSTNMAYRDVFFKGQAAMVLTGSWMYDDIMNTQKFPHDFVTVFASFPRWKNSPAGRTQGSCSYYSINKNSQNKEAAYLFARYITEEGAAVIGELPSVKGSDYTKVINDKIGDNAKLFDVNSLLSIWNNKALQPNMITKFPETFKALDDMFNVETEKYMVGGADLDTTMNNIVKQGKDILKK